MSNNVWDFVDTHGLSLDLAEFEFRLSSLDSMSLKSALHIIKNSEVFPGSLDTNYIHDSKWEPGVSPDLSVDLDHSFFISDDLEDLLS